MSARWLSIACFALGLTMIAACSAPGGTRRRDGGGGPGDDTGTGDFDAGLDYDSGTGDQPDASSGLMENCADGQDNTGDGLVDEGCACTSDWQYCWSGPPERRGIGACRDGIQMCENFTPEFSSWGACDGEVLPTEEIDGDGIDQDCDGYDGGTGTSCPEFEDCGPNGIDENCNGLADCADPQCSSDPACGCGAAEFGCGNGADEDCDGYIDCHDPDCGSDPTCMTTPPPPPGCTPEFPFVAEIWCGDGRDNDCDGHIDCDDSDCLHPGSCGCPSTEGVCTDGADNDCDGVSDCGDTDCQTCTPGSHRYCDDPMYCHWGQQTCDSSGHWGTCTETTDRPGTCDGTYYSASCCVDAGACCENYPTDHTSIGTCSGISTCTGG